MWKKLTGYRSETVPFIQIVLHVQQYTADIYSTDQLIVKRRAGKSLKTSYLS